MIGFTPVFSLAPDDPIVAALQAGQRPATVAFNGDVSDLNLRGAREALDSFKTHCGWTQGANAKDASAKDANARDARAKEPVSVATFKCAEGKSIGAVFYDDRVDLKLSDGRMMQLPQAISGSGARYANDDESFVFWNKGDTAFVTEGPDETMTFKDCVSGK
jgi:membrane-bound inhibitor of C-type lysozyme